MRIRAVGGARLVSLAGQHPDFFAESRNLVLALEQDGVQAFDTGSYSFTPFVFAVINFPEEASHSPIFHLTMQTVNAPS